MKIGINILKIINKQKLQKKSLKNYIKYKVFIFAEKNKIGRKNMKTKIGKKTLLCYLGKHLWVSCPPLPDLPIDIPLGGTFKVCPRCLKFRGSFSAKDYKMAIVPIKIDKN